MQKTDETRIDLESEEYHGGPITSIAITTSRGIPVIRRNDLNSYFPSRTQLLAQIMIIKAQDYIDMSTEDLKIEFDFLTSYDNVKTALYK